MAQTQSAPPVSALQAAARRLDKLQAIEQEISKMLNLAAGAVEELSKDSPSGEIVEYKTKDFVKTVEGIEKKLSDEIQYLGQVSTSQAHEGSVYGAEKDYELSVLQNLVAKERASRYTTSSLTADLTVSELTVGTLPHSSDGIL